MYLKNKLIQFHAFTKVVEFRSFIKAANYLNISASSVTKFVHELEENYKVRLLIRTTRNIELTEDGYKFYEVCNNFINESVELDNFNTIEDISGKLSIYSSESFADKCIIPILDDYIKKYPEVILNLNFTDNLEEAYINDYDIVLGLLNYNKQNYIQKKLLTTNYIYCASNEYINNYGAPIYLNNLSNFKIITHKHRQEQVNNFITVNSVNLMIKLAISNQGIILIHKYLVEDYLKQNILKEITMKDYKSKEVGLFGYYKNYNYLNGKVKSFLDYLNG